jgi:hypothetical protein
MMFTCVMYAVCALKERHDAKNFVMLVLTVPQSSSAYASCSLIATIAAIAITIVVVVDASRSAIRCGVFRAQSHHHSLLWT